MTHPIRRATGSDQHWGQRRRNMDDGVLIPVTSDMRARGCGLGDVVLAATPFVWLGMVLAISFVETPLKFQAPGITVALGLHLGRLVFPVLNVLELLSALTVTGLLLRRRRRAITARRVWSLLGGLWAVLLTQAFLLRPVLDDRALTLIAGGSLPDAPWHLLYIALELLKMVGLAALGSATVALTARTANRVRGRAAGSDG